MKKFDIVEKVYKVYFITDGEISILYSGQDTGKSFGLWRHYFKNLIVCQIKNIKTYYLNDGIERTDCELFINGTWNEWCTKRRYIDDAIKFYKKNSELVVVDGGYPQPPKEQK
jgi:hypothetical protein